MPSFDFKCGLIHEVVCSMDRISGTKIWCPECNKDNLKCGPLGTTPISDTVWMRRLYNSGGVLFKGEDWPTQDLKRTSEDSNIQRQRRKAAALKNTGVVPRDAIIGFKEADERYDASKLPDSKIDDFYMKRVKDE